MSRSREICILLAMPPSTAGKRQPGKMAADARIRFAWAGLFFLLVFSIFYVGAQPVAASLFPEPYDKVAHLAVFFVLTVSAGLAGLHRFPWQLLLLGFALGAADELHQLFLPGRFPGWEDWLADCIAVSLAVVTMPALLRMGTRYSSRACD